MGGKGSGRKPKSELRKETAQCIAESSPYAAKYLKEVANGTSPANSARIDACKYIINQDIGAPRQRTEITGENGPVVFKVVYD